MLNVLWNGYKFKDHSGTFLFQDVEFKNSHVGSVGAI